MKNLSLLEFRDYCDALSGNKFIFSSSNQTADCTDNTIDIELSFDTMFIAFNPNIIFFKKDQNSICLSRVKAVRIPEGETLNSMVFHVVCGDLYDAAGDREYIFIIK